MFFIAVSCTDAYNKSLSPQRMFLDEHGPCAAENVTIHAGSILTQKEFVMESLDAGSSVINLMAVHSISVSTHCVSSNGNNTHTKSTSPAQNETELPPQLLCEWDEKKSDVHRCFGGTYCLHLQGQIIN
jgi:hypothetical protein